MSLAAPDSKRIPSRGEVHFYEEDGRNITFPHDEALDITLHIGGFDVEKILVDTGSSANMLYYSACKKIGLSKRDLKPFRQLLVCFAGETILPNGYVTLQVIVGDESTTKTQTRSIDFLVVDAPSAYNGLLGRPSRVAFKLMIVPCFTMI